MGGMDAGRARELLDFVVEASHGLDGADASAWQARIGERLPELKNALDWLIASGHADDAARAAIALDGYWMASGELAQGGVWLTDVLASSSLGSAARAEALHSHGLLAFWRGDDATARRALDESLSVADTAGAQTLALAGLARLALREGHIDEAALSVSGA